jgi:hypothetical protein
MAFPSLHRYPGDVPAVRQEGHAFDDIGAAEDVPFERGEDRARRLYTVPLQVVSVSTKALTQAQFDSFSRWYEDDLRAGSQRFDLLVAGQGGTAPAWWAAQLVGRARYRATSGRYVVTAQLLLVDGPYDTRTAPGMHGLMSQLAQHRALMAADVLLRGLMAQAVAHPGRLAAPALAGLMEQHAEHPGELGAPGSLRITDDGTERETDDGTAREIDA